MLNKVAYISPARQEARAIRDANREQVAAAQAAAAQAAAQHKRERAEAQQRALAPKGSMYPERQAAEAWIETAMAPYRAKRRALPAALKLQIFEIRREYQRGEKMWK